MKLWSNDLMNDDDLIVNSGKTTGVLDAEGGLGNDTFTVARSSFANANLDGEDGSDTYTIRVADHSQRRIVARDSGTFGTDSIDIVGTVLTDRVTMRVGLDETPFRNHVNVTPSVDTAFSFFGKGGFNTIQLVEAGSDSNQFFSEDGIQGTFKLDNSMRDIYFEDFFVTS